MKNTLTDLNNHLFAQLERLGNESLSSDELKTEIERTKAISAISQNVIANARLVLDAQNAIYDTPNYERKTLPSILQ
jgi:aminoglycoside/choline kinase family phosphotransferase